jgi:hypothetical protein
LFLSRSLVFPLAIILMKSFFLLGLVTLVNGFDFTGLLSKIRKATLNYDHEAAEKVNKEEDQLSKIELKETAIDRQLADVIQRYHLEKKPRAFSLLEKRNRHRHSQTVTVPELQPLEEDVRIMEKTEINREKAQKEFLETEQKMVDLPETLTHRKANKIRAEMNAPLDDDNDQDTLYED